MDDLSDRELMVMFKHGRREAFDVLFERYRDYVWSYLRRLLGDETTAEDLTQEVFLSVIRSRKSYEPEAPFAAWIFRIATNAARSHLRRDRRGRIQSLSDENEGSAAPDAAASPRDLAYGRELSSALESAVRDLPETLKEVFLLRQLDRLSDADIAEALDLAPASIRVYLHRARRQLYEKLRPLLDENGEKNADD